MAFRPRQDGRSGSLDRSADHSTNCAPCTTLGSAMDGVAIAARRPPLGIAGNPLCAGLALPSQPIWMRATDALA